MQELINCCKHTNNIYVINDDVTQYRIREKSTDLTKNFKNTVPIFVLSNSKQINNKEFYKLRTTLSSWDSQPNNKL